jgi:hypothetical protein
MDQRGDAKLHRLPESTLGTGARRSNEAAAAVVLLWHTKNRIALGGL